MLYKLTENNKMHCTVHNMHSYWPHTHTHTHTHTHPQQQQPTHLWIKLCNKLSLLLFSLCFTLQVPNFLNACVHADAKTHVRVKKFSKFYPDKMYQPPQIWMWVCDQLKTEYNWYYILSCNLSNKTMKHLVYVHQINLQTDKNDRLASHLLYPRLYFTNLLSTNQNKHLLRVITADVAKCK